MARVLALLLGSVFALALPLASPCASDPDCQFDDVCDLSTSNCTCTPPCALGALASPPYPSPCASDADCQNNGVCDLSTTNCTCTPPWTGPNCAMLALQPSDRAAFGTCDGNTLNGTAVGAMTTWGGLPVQDPATGTWHLHPAEMALHCGMTRWASLSQVGHWTAPAVEGPYTRVGTAVGTFAHNPVVIAAPPGTPDNVHYLLFHIGTGCASTGPHACNYTALPVCENGTTPGNGGGRSPDPIPTPPNLSFSHTHVAASLDGPWVGLPDGWTTPACPNNPAPLFLPNGSLLILCHEPMAPGLSCPTSGGLSYAVSSTANWTHGDYTVRCVNLTNPSFTSPNGSTYMAANEDPHAYLDANGVIHVLTHNQGPGYLNLSWWGGDVRGDGGHFFSADMGETWHFTWHAVYSGLVDFTDGTQRRYKRERPKLVQDPATLVPIALANGIGVELVDAFAPYNDSACTMVARL
jgi:hypothetical protein